MFPACHEAVAPCWLTEPMDLRIHPCEFLRRFPSGVPRDIAVIKGEQKGVDCLQWGADTKQGVVLPIDGDGMEKPADPSSNTNCYHVVSCRA